MLRAAATSGDTYPIRITGSLDPLFVDYAGRGLHLQAGSSAIHYAVLEYSPVSDFDGSNRPAAPDAGAYERRILQIGRFRARAAHA